MSFLPFNYLVTDTHILQATMKNGKVSVITSFSTTFDAVNIGDNFEEELCEISEKVETSILFEDDSFDEELCRICEKVEISLAFEDGLNGELYKLCQNVEDHTNKSPLQIGGILRKLKIQENASTKRNAKRTRYEDTASTSSPGYNSLGDEVIKCSLCQILLLKRYFAHHVRSNLHKSNIHSLKAVKMLHDSKIISFKNNSLDINNVNKSVRSRGHYITLPGDIQAKKAVINVKNFDNLCFKWALLSALYPVAKNSSRVASYTWHSDKLNFYGVNFPVKIYDVPKVERLNDISINVFGLEYDLQTKTHSVVGPLYYAKCIKTNHVNLLYISCGDISHFCYIKNLSRLVSRQFSKGKVYICGRCLLHFPSQERLSNHGVKDCSDVMSLTFTPQLPRTRGALTVPWY